MGGRAESKCHSGSSDRVRALNRCQLNSPVSVWALAAALGEHTGLGYKVAKRGFPQFGWYSVKQWGLALALQVVKAHAAELRVSSCKAHKTDFGLFRDETPPHPTQNS